MKNTFFFAFLILSVGIYSSCGEENTVTPEEINTNPLDIIEIKALDARNSASANDIFVQLSSNSNIVDKVRLVLVPTLESKDFTLEKGQSLAPSSYTEIIPDFKIFQLPIGLKDSNGNDISHNQYTLRVLAYKDTDVMLSDKSAFVSLEFNNPLEGKYTGLWNDDIYTDFPISFEISSGNNTNASGEFYYSALYIPCCQNISNDGTIILEFDTESGEVSKFEYDQVLTNYKGGECNTTYTGFGTIEGLDLTLSYTGTDCDGPHGDGLITSKRMWE